MSDYTDIKRGTVMIGGTIYEENNHINPYKEGLFIVDKTHKAKTIGKVQTALLNTHND